MARRLAVVCLLVAAGIAVTSMVGSNSATAPRATALTNHVVLISIDGLAASDLQRAASLPVLGSFIENGFYAREVTSVYPSLTFPAHTSAITGTRPGTHGITANNPLSPGVDNPPWYFWAKDIRVPTLYQIAKAEGLRTACILWPVTANARFDYLLPEIWPTKPGEKQVSLALRNGTPLTLIGLQLRFGKLLNGETKSALDDFTAASAAYILRTRKPNLLITHLVDLDEQRHNHGTLSNEALNALAQSDRRVGAIVDAARSAGMLDRTTFVVMGDHGFIDTHSAVALNSMLADNGLIMVNADGTIASYRAISNSCDGSAHVYVDNESDMAYVEEVLRDLAAKWATTGVESVHRASEYGLDATPGLAFVVEAVPGYYFTNSLKGSLVSPGNYRAMHGYSPFRADMKTALLAFGKGVRRGSSVPEAALIDVAPTIAALLGLTMPTAEGQVIEAMLNR